jgi:UDPglucose 6-dehydrogenase
MRICVVGSGYVGLVTGACFADSGNHVLCVDSDPSKVALLAAGRCPFFEPGLEELMRANMAAGRLRFTTDLPAAVPGAQVIFLAVGTPPRPDGSADLTHIEAAAADVARALTGPTVLVVKSTVPVNTGARLEALVQSLTSHRCPLVSNPEFLKEGAALSDFFRPDRVVIGAEDSAAGDLVAELHKPFVRNSKPILRMQRAAAELTKYAANAYLATRISFINEIAEVCARFGVDIDQVRQGIGSDARIGHHFLYPGLGYGGSCFPKDVQALASSARSVGVTCDILDAVHRRNVAQRTAMLGMIRDRLGPDLRGRQLAVWGLAFKPNTDDIREAPAVAILEGLLSAGATAAVHDPKALENARRVFGERLTYCADAYAALPGADGLLVCTEWMEFRSPDFDALRAALKRPLIFDGRNVYDPAMMRRHGFEYYSVGRPPVTADAPG